MISWSTACPDWQERIVNKQSLIPFPPIFPEYAEKAWGVFSQLKIYDIPGHPTFGEVSRPWVKDLVKAIFGAYDEKTGKMLIREIFLFVSKKNTKSTLAAAVMMTSLILNWRDSAEFIILAPTVKVASNSFIPASNMCREDIDSELSDLMHVQDHYKKIKNRNSNAFLNVVAADSQTVSGIKATSVFIDELHEFGKHEKSEGMLIEATGGLMSRPEGFIVYATTQSDDPPAGIFAKKLDYARKVRDGKIEDKTFLPVLYEFPQNIIDQELHLNPKYFYITNPNMGASVDEEFLVRTYLQEVEKGKDSVQKFIAKHLNVQVGMSLREHRWVGADFWAECAGSVTLQDVIDRSEVIVIGIDGGGLDDLLGIAVLGRDKYTRVWLLWNKAWIHPIALERRKSEVTKYRDFERAGDLVIVENIGDDVEQVGEIITRCEESGLLDNIGIDPVGIGEIIDKAQEIGLDPDERVKAISQGWRMNGAIKTLERRLAEKSIVHGGKALMQWCAGNARCEPKGNAVLITKAVSGTGKIDPLMATINAVQLMALNPEAKHKSSHYDGMTKDEIIERIAF